MAKSKFDFDRRVEEIEAEIMKTVKTIEFDDHEFFDEESKNSAFELVKRIDDNSGNLYLNYFKENSSNPDFEIEFKESELDELIDLLLIYKIRKEKS